MSSQGIEMSEENLNKYLNDPKLITRFQDYIKFRGGFNTSFIVDEFHQKVPYKFASVMKLLADGNVKASNGDYSKSNDGVVLIPHSQGNLYANTLFMYLTSEKINIEHIAIFGIASPADKNYTLRWIAYGRGYLNKYLGDYPIEPYVTSCTDSVIDTLRVSNPVIIETLRYIFSFGYVPFNGVASCNAVTGSIGHNLIDYYLKDPELKKRVILGVNEAAYMTDKLLMWNINTETMFPLSSYYKKDEPKVYAMSFAYNQNVPQIMGTLYYDNSGNLNIQKMWYKGYDYDSNPGQLVTLRTPYLDDIAAKIPDDSGGHYPPALDHQASIPNRDVVGLGYAADTRFYLFEDTSDANNPIYNRIQMNPFSQYITGTRTVYYTYGRATYPVTYENCETGSSNYSGLYFNMGTYFTYTDIDRIYPLLSYTMNRMAIPGGAFSYSFTKCQHNLRLINGKYFPDGYFSPDAESEYK